jgi:hypothetical protein
VNYRNPHAKIDEENRERDRLWAAAIRDDPSVIERARARLQAWIDGEAPGRIPPAFDEWRAILTLLCPEEVASFLESRTPKAERLRQSSPFMGLGPPARAEVS